MKTDIRYSRQIALPSIGAGGQARLRDASVLIVGAGGLGTPAGMYLAGSGVGQLLINDFDRIDVSNLPRQLLYRSSDSGAYKARIAAERLQEINPATDVIALEERLQPSALEECVATVDAVLDCTDSFASRWLLNEICFRQHKPLVSGAAIRWEGQVAVFRNADGQGPCYRCLYSEADENLNDCAGQGIVAPVAGTVGCMLATETLKILLGIESQLAGKLWVYDGLAGSSRTLGIPARDDCPVCGRS
jgi:adenylyltransferase/sulfurtransferase